MYEYLETGTTDAYKDKDDINSYYLGLFDSVYNKEIFYNKTITIFNLSVVWLNYDYYSIDDDRILYSKIGPIYKNILVRDDSTILPYLAFGGSVFYVTLKNGKRIKCEGQYWASNSEELSRGLNNTVELIDICVQYKTEDNFINVMVTKEFYNLLIKKFNLKEGEYNGDC